MIHIRTQEEIEVIRTNALLITATLTEVAMKIRPGVRTISLDSFAEQFIRDHGGVPSFKGYGPRKSPFPFSLCISLNDVVVHGFPSDREILPGDVISVDCGIYKNGYHADHAYTFAVGEIPDSVSRLMRVTKEALAFGIQQARENNRVGDISFVIEQHTAREHGFGVVRELVGHGVGRELHEDPQVPNFGRQGEGKRLREGMILAIEPMINLGGREVFTDEDGWTVRTMDRKVAVHYEHTTLVRKSEGESLSDFRPIEAAERLNPELSKAHLDEVRSVVA